MVHEILSIKLCELEEQLARLSSRIHLSETAGPAALQQEIRALSRELAESELTLRKKLQLSRAQVVAALAVPYEKIEQIIGDVQAELAKQAAGRDDAAEEKILLAEYALDFALQAANDALLLSMEAIDVQRHGRDAERRPL